MARAKSPRFVDLSRNKRADAVFELKHEISRGGFPGFLCYEEINGHGSWSDVYFIGRDKWTLWNATLVTPADARNELLENEADVVATSLIGKAVAGALPLSAILNRPAKRWDELGGRTRNEFLDHLIAKWRDDPERGMVRSGATIHRDYRYGIGLHAVIEDPYITVDAITRFIDRFLSNGEVAYESPHPVPWDVVTANVRSFNLIAQRLEPRLASQ